MGALIGVYDCVILSDLHFLLLGRYLDSKYLRPEASVQFMTWLYSELLSLEKIWLLLLTW